MTLLPHLDSLPAYANYTKYLSPVKNQKGCGASFAFSAAAAIEHKPDPWRNISQVSAQNLIDCTLKYGNHGCKGGDYNRAYQYVIDNVGVDDRQNYPYEAKMLKVLILAIVAGVIAATTDTDWAEFKKKYEKEYEGDIDLIRKAIWQDNIKKINSHNVLYTKGLSTFYMGENEFTDMTQDEFDETMKGFIASKDSSHAESKKISRPKKQMKPLPHLDSLPAYVNNTKYLSPVKNQKGCGASFAFAAAAAIEHKPGSWLPIAQVSAQNLIDCTLTYGNHGCKGGDYNRAYDYVTDNLGVDCRRNYPYEAKVGRCRFSRDVCAELDGWHDIKPHTESTLQQAVAQFDEESVAKGPTAAINALESFRHYKGGVYDDPKCNSTINDHAMLIAGYGTTKDGKDYWIVKNSWGTSWGEYGYAQMSRNKNNQCGIANHGSYPYIWT